jgi:hypothetical protein
MRKHVIEFLCMTPNRTLETIRVTVEAKTSPKKLAALTKQIRAVLELVIEPEPPLSIEHCRDYAIRTR